MSKIFGGEQWGGGGNFGNIFEERKLGWAGVQREGNFGHAAKLNKGAWGRGGVIGVRGGRVARLNLGTPDSLVRV